MKTYANFLIWLGRVAVTGLAALGIIAVFGHEAALALTAAALMAVFLVIWCGAWSWLQKRMP